VSPTPEQAEAQARDHFHATRAAANLDDHESLKAVGAAGAAWAHIRTAIAHKDDTPEQTAKADQLKADFMDRLPRTMLGPNNDKGRAPWTVLSYNQFAQYKETGSWDGNPWA